MRGAAGGSAGPMSSRLDAAFAAAPREQFLPPDQRPYAALDRPLPIGHGVTCSQPSTVRTMLALLGPAPGHRVLDVGSGSGWTTALLAELVAPGGSVIGVELIPEVLALGREHLAGRSGTTLQQAHPAVLGWPDGAPYDRVLVSAEAATLPTELVDQLVVGGVLVGPVRGEMQRVVRTADGVDVERHGRYLFVPLRTLNG